MSKKEIKVFILVHFVVGARVFEKVVTKIRKIF